MGIKWQGQFLSNIYYTLDGQAYQQVAGQLHFSKE
jgi:hypothetical protein